jgi:hypothetical protein
MSDLFEHPEKWPTNLTAILEIYSTESELDYIQLEAMKQECEAIGYTFKYDLSATPYNLKKIKP